MVEQFAKFGTITHQIQRTKKRNNFLHGDLNKYRKQHGNTRGLVDKLKARIDMTQIEIIEELTFHMKLLQNIIQGTSFLVNRQSFEPYMRLAALTYLVKFALSIFSLIAASHYSL